MQTAASAWRLSNYTVASVAGYLPLSGGTLTGGLIGTAATFSGNTALGDAEADTLSVSGSVVKNATGNWVIPAPSSGNTVSATGVAGATVFNAVVPGGGVSYGYQGFNGTAQFSQFFDGVNNAYVGTTTNHPLIIRSNNADRITLAAAGTVTISAPSSGVALTVNAVGSGIGFSVIGNAAGVAPGIIGIRDGKAGTREWLMSAGLIVAGEWTLYDNTRSSAVITASGAGNVTIAAPSSGVAETITGVAGADAWVANGGTSGSFRVNATGVPYGTALHNNAGAVTGTTNQYVASGTYTPTLTNTANISASTAHVCQWIRVGNVCTVSGRVDVDAAALALTTMGISLPIPSALTLTTQLGGSAVPDGVFGNVRVAAIFGDAINDRATFQLNTDSLANETYFLSFTYLIL